MLGEIVPAERHGVVLKLIAQAIAYRPIEIVVAGIKNTAASWSEPADGSPQAPRLEEQVERNAAAIH